LNLPVVPQKEVLVETSNDNVPIEVIDENGNPIETENNSVKNDATENKNKESEKNNEENEESKAEIEKNQKEEAETKKITDYAVVLYEKAKIPYAKIHQTTEQLELLLFIPEVYLSSIDTRFLGNTFYLEAMSKIDNQLYQYLIKLPNSINIDECGFMVVDVPDEQAKKGKEGITQTTKAVKCMIRKAKPEWWSNNIFEIKPKISTLSETSKEEEKETSDNENKKSIVDYIYKDGEMNKELFEFNEKIFLTELFVNKLDDYLTKQEKEPKTKKDDEMPQWLRDAINPPKKEKNSKI